MPGSHPLTYWHYLPLIKKMSNWTIRKMLSTWTLPYFSSLRKQKFKREKNTRWTASNDFFKGGKDPTSLTGPALLRRLRATGAVWIFSVCPKVTKNMNTPGNYQTESDPNKTYGNGPLKTKGKSPNKTNPSKCDAQWALAVRTVNSCHWGGLGHNSPGLHSYKFLMLSSVQWVPLSCKKFPENTAGTEL